MSRTSSPRPGAQRRFRDWQRSLPLERHAAASEASSPPGASRTVFANLPKVGNAVGQDWHDLARLKPTAIRAFGALPPNTSALSARLRSLSQHRPRGRLRSLAGPSHRTRPRVQLDRIALARGDIVPSPKRLRRLRSLAGPSPTARPRVQEDRLALAPGDVVPSPKRPTLAVRDASPSPASGLSRTASSSSLRPGARSPLPRRATPLSDNTSSPPAPFGGLAVSYTFSRPGSAWPPAETSASTSLGRTPLLAGSPAILS